jgi:ATP adenylyltransferase
MSFPKEEIEALWAPWRVEYFALQRPLDDFLTAAAETSDDAAHLVVLRRKSAFLLMNRYPYAAGHLMAVPYRKTADLAVLTGDEKLELFDLADFAQRLLRRTMRAEGFNIGLNLGTCAGAGVADHLHLHIVPRWPGDNNFMAVTGQTRVISEGLDSLYAKLVQARDALEAGPVATH